MSDMNRPKNPIADWEKVREEWLNRLSALVASVENWAQELGWSTRRIEIRMEDSQIGNHQAPALLLQEENIRVLLEPIGRSAPGVEGVVDLYRMPAYDDIASLFYSDGGWQLHYLAPGTPVAVRNRETKSKPLSKETFAEVLHEMRAHAA